VGAGSPPSAAASVVLEEALLGIGRQRPDLQQERAGLIFRMLESRDAATAARFGHWVGVKEAGAASSSGAAVAPQQPPEQALFGGVAGFGWGPLISAPHLQQHPLGKSRAQWLQHLDTIRMEAEALESTSSIEQGEMHLQAQLPLPCLGCSEEDQRVEFYHTDPAAVLGGGGVVFGGLLLGGGGDDGVLVGDGAGFGAFGGFGAPAVAEASPAAEAAPAVKAAGEGGSLGLGLGLNFGLALGLDFGGCIQQQQQQQQEEVVPAWEQLGFGRPLQLDEAPAQPLLAFGGGDALQGGGMAPHSALALLPSSSSLF